MLLLELAGNVRELCFCRGWGWEGQALVGGCFYRVKSLSEGDQQRLAELSEQILSPKMFVEPLDQAMPEADSPKFLCAVSQ